MWERRLSWGGGGSGCRSGIHGDVCGRGVGCGVVLQKGCPDGGGVGWHVGREVFPSINKTTNFAALSS